MNTLSKGILLTTCIITMGSLAACQSTPLPPDPAKPLSGPHGKPDREHRLNPEQKARFQERRAEREQRMQLIKNACDGKTIGQTVQVTFNDKVITGTCELHFKPVKPEPRPVAAQV